MIWSLHVNKGRLFSRRLQTVRIFTYVENAREHNSPGARPRGWKQSVRLLRLVQKSPVRALNNRFREKKRLLCSLKSSKTPRVTLLTVSSRRMKRQGRRKRRPRLQKHPKFIGQESESTSQTNLLQGITRLPNWYDVNYLNLLINFPRNWIWLIQWCFEIFKYSKGLTLQV